jgi:hypothetical protein
LVGVSIVTTEPKTAVLTLAQRDAIFQEIDFAFESARDLPFLLQYGAESLGDRIDARDLIWHLQVALRLLDQLGWGERGNRAGYVLEVDADTDRFAARMERYALIALEANRRGLLDDDEDQRASAQEMIDGDLDTLEAARVVRVAFERLGAEA